MKNRSNGLGAAVLFVGATAGAVFGVATARAQCEGVTFAPAVNYGVGTFHEDMALGDLDGDGDLDVAAVGFHTDVLRFAVLVNTGDGTFAPVQFYAVGTPRSLSLGDVDGDGDLDAVMTDANAPVHAVVVARNNGDATFGPPASYSAGGHDAEPDPVATALADLDNDGDLDIAVANRHGNKVTVLKNSGDGTFTYWVEGAAGDTPSAIAAGDVDRDGDVDIVTANYGGNSVSVLRNHGDGSFSPQVQYAAGDGPGSVALGDVTGDGILDIAVADVGVEVSVLQGQAGGTFAARVAYSGSQVGWKIALGDIDADSDLDIVVPNEQSSGAGVYLNSGGAFAYWPTDANVGGWPWTLALGDIDLDGWLDVGVLAQGSAGLAVLLNATSGVYITDQPRDLGVCPGDGAELVVGVHAEGSVSYQWRKDGADINGATGPSYSIGSAAPQDGGVYDVVLTGDCGVATSRSARLVVLSDVFAMEHYPTGRKPMDVALGDLDADGDADMAVANRYAYTVSVLLSAGDGEFAPAVNYGPLSGPNGVAMGDIDADGDVDIMTANLEGASVGVLRNNGDGTFAPALTYPCGYTPRWIVLGDMDSDGDLDVVVSRASWDEGLCVLLNNGDGTLGPAAMYATGDDPHGIALGDLDGDDDLDVAVTTSSYFGTSDAAVWFNSGNGELSGRVDYGGYMGPIDVALGDVDGDSDLDMVLAGGYVAVYSNDGNGAFPAWTGYGMSGGASDVALGDMDGDGDLDMAVPIINSHEVSVVLNDGNGLFPAANRWPAGLYPGAIALGDVDADGDLDIATTHDVGSTAQDGASVLLNLGHLPLIFEQPLDVGACPATSAAFFVDVGGAGSWSFQWRKDGADIAGATGSSYVITGVTPKDVGTYDVVVTNECGSVASETAELTLLMGSACCRADWNHDGITNSTDVSDFINAWFEDQTFGTLETDWDGNGVSNSTDVSAFINSWFEDSAAGCGL